MGSCREYPFVSAASPGVEEALDWRGPPLDTRRRSPPELPPARTPPEELAGGPRPRSTPLFRGLLLICKSVLWISPTPEGFWRIPGEVT